MHHFAVADRHSAAAACYPGRQVGQHGHWGPNSSAWQRHLASPASRGGPPTHQGEPCVVTRALAIHSSCTVALGMPGPTSGCCLLAPMPRASCMVAPQASHERLFSFDLDSDVSLEEAVKTGRCAATNHSRNQRDHLCLHACSCIAMLTRINCSLPGICRLQLWRSGLTEQSSSQGLWCRASQPSRHSAMR